KGLAQQSEAAQRLVRVAFAPQRMKHRQLRVLEEDPRLLRETLLRLFQEQLGGAQSEQVAQGQGAAGIAGQAIWKPAADALEPARRFVEFVTMKRDPRMLASQPVMLRNARHPIDEKLFRLGILPHLRDCLGTPQIASR